MSHQPQRAEKDCLNCGAEVAGRYCQQCGQQNIVPHQKFGHLLQHFIADLFHFDGKFFDTLRYLLFRPGRVAREYIAGKRVKYLDPIRMYLFTSAIFFLIFFTFNKYTPNDDLTVGSLSIRQRYEVASELSHRPVTPFEERVLRGLLDTTKWVYLDEAETRSDSVIRFRGATYLAEVKIDSSEFKLRKRFPKDNWLHRLARNRIRAFDERIRTGDATAQSSLINGILHQLPYMLFVSLPFFALLLKLLYVRRKNFFFADHLVFTLYHYIFNFILLLAVMGTVALGNRTGLGIFDWVVAGLLITGLIYLYKGMRNFYGQGRKRTIVKFLALNLLGCVLIALLFVIFVIISAFQIH